MSNLLIISSIIKEECKDIYAVVSFFNTVLSKDFEVAGGCYSNRKDQFIHKVMQLGDARYFTDDVEKLIFDIYKILTIKEQKLVNKVVYERKHKLFWGNWINKNITGKGILILIISIIILFCLGLGIIKAETIVQLLLSK